jgi:diguanylate cyclase (GGDEF)-like protein
MTIHPPIPLQADFGGMAALAKGQAFTVLTVGSEAELTRQVQRLLDEAGLAGARLVALPTIDIAIDRLQSERPRIVFLAVAAPELADLSAMIRLQAAAPGVPVVPLPVVAPSGGTAGGWWPMRVRRGVNRVEVVGLLQQLALLDEGARRLFYLATHDGLTGLANRWLLEERLAHAVARSRRGTGRGALLFIDLDHFKAVNDRHGHEIGDRLLVLVAERLTRSVRASDTVARWGGDEFVVLLEGVENRDLAHAKGRELVQRVAEPCDALQHVAPLRASVGVALFPCDGTDAAALMIQADRRMYRAKGRRVLWSVFRRG